MKIIDVKQNTKEWFEARYGIPSASCFDNIITTTGKLSTQSQKYAYKLAAERISKTSEETYQSADMLRGVEMEDEARKMYEMIYGVEVKQVGFCIKEEPLCGASPDGMIGDKGLLEIKCPKAATHVSYILDDKLPTDYIAQVQGQLFVTGHDYCDFMSYYPGLKPFIKRVYPDLKFHKQLEEALILFNKELESIIERIK